MFCRYTRKMKKFAIFTSLLAGVSASGGGDGQCTEKVLATSSTAALSDGTGIGDACFEVHIGSSSWNLVYKMSDVGCDAEGAGVTANPDGNFVMMTGSFDADGAPVASDTYKSLTDGSDVTLTTATGPSDMIEGPAEKFTCKDCMGIEGYTGAETLDQDSDSSTFGQCVLTYQGVRDYIADLETQLEQKQNAAAQADLDEIKEELDELLATASTDATSASDAIKEKVEHLFTQHAAAHLDDLRVKIDTALYEKDNLINSKQSELEQAEALASQAQADLDKAQTDLNTAQDALTTTQSELDEALSTLVIAERDKQTLQDQYDEAEMDLDDAEYENSYLLNQLEQANTNLANAQTELDTAQTQLDTAQTELNTAQTELNTAQTQLNTAQTELNTVQTELNAARNDVSGFEGIIVAEYNRIHGTDLSHIGAVLTAVTAAGGDNPTPASVLQAMLDTYHFDPSVLLNVLGYAADSSELLEHVLRLADIETKLASQFSSLAVGSVDAGEVEAAIEALKDFKTQFETIQTSVFNDLQNNGLLDAVYADEAAWLAAGKDVASEFSRIASALKTAQTNLENQQHTINALGVKVNKLYAIGEAPTDIAGAYATVIADIEEEEKKHPDEKELGKLPGLQERKKFLQLWIDANSAYQTALLDITKALQGDSSATEALELSVIQEEIGKLKEVREAIDGLYDKNGNLIDADTPKELVVEKINYMKDVVQAIFNGAKEHGYINSQFTLETFPDKVGRWEEEMVVNLSVSIHKIAIKLTALEAEVQNAGLNKGQIVTEVQSLEAEISTLETSVSNLQSQLQTLNDWGESILQDSFSFNDLDDDQVTIYENHIATAKLLLDGVEASDGVAAVEGLLAKKSRLEFEITNLESQITGHKDQLRPWYTFDDYAFTLQSDLTMLDINLDSIEKLRQIEGILATAEQDATDNPENLDVLANVDLYQKQRELQKKKMGVGKLAAEKVPWIGIYYDYNQSPSSVVDVDFDTLSADDLWEKFQAFKQEVIEHSASASDFAIIQNLQDTESSVEQKKLELESTKTSIAYEEKLKLIAEANLQGYYRLQIALNDALLKDPAYKDLVIPDAYRSQSEIEDMNFEQLNYYFDIEEPAIALKIAKADAEAKLDFTGFIQDVEMMKTALATAEENLDEKREELANKIADLESFHENAVQDFSYMNSLEEKISQLYAEQEALLTDIHTAETNSPKVQQLQEDLSVKGADLEKAESDLETAQTKLGNLMTNIKNADAAIKSGIDNLEDTATFGDKITVITDRISNLNNEVVDLTAQKALYDQVKADLATQQANAISEDDIGEDANTLLEQQQAILDARAELTTDDMDNARSALDSLRIGENAPFNGIYGAEKQYQAELEVLSDRYMEMKNQREDLQNAKSVAESAKNNAADASVIAGLQAKIDEYVQQIAEINALEWFKDGHPAEDSDYVNTYQETLETIVNDRISAWEEDLAAKLQAHQVAVNAYISDANALAAKEKQFLDKHTGLKLLLEKKKSVLQLLIKTYFKLDEHGNPDPDDPAFRDIWHPKILDVEMSIEQIDSYATVVNDGGVIYPFDGTIYAKQIDAQKLAFNEVKLAVEKQQYSYNNIFQKYQDLWPKYKDVKEALAEAKQSIGGNEKDIELQLARITHLEGVESKLRAELVAAGNTYDTLLGEKDALDDKIATIKSSLALYAGGDAETKASKAQTVAEKLDGVLDEAGATVVDKAEEARKLELEMDDLITQVQNFEMVLHTFNRMNGDEEVQVTGKRTGTDVFNRDSADDRHRIDDLIKKLKQDYGYLKKHAEDTEGAFTLFKETATEMQKHYKSISEECDSWGI